MKALINQQINYGFDKVGRLNNVSGSTAFAGITNYADTPTYNARGILTHLNYGNGVEMNITNFNNKLQATNFEVKKDTTSIIKKNYEFYADSSLKYSQDVVDAKFDRSYKYDFASRITEAKTGLEARGGTVPLENQAASLPYRQSYNYNVYNQLTQRNNRHWGVEYWYGQSNNLNYSYLNNRMIGGEYLFDADGRSLNEPYSNSESTYDTAGEMTRILTHFDSNVSRFQDGNSHESKRTTLRWVEDSNGIGSWTNLEIKYFIRSSVSNNEVISEADSTGRKTKTFVKAAGATIALQIQSTQWNGVVTQNMMFDYIDASGASGRKTWQDGNVINVEGFDGSPVENDGLGGNVGASTPYIEINPIPEEGCIGCTILTNENPTYVNGRRVTATLDGFAIDFGRAMSLLQNGGAIPAALERYQGRNGFSFEYLGAGLFQTNIPDAWRTYKDGKPNPIFYEPHGKSADGELVSQGGIYLISWSARLALAGTVNENRGGQTKTDTKIDPKLPTNLKAGVQEVANKPNCKDALQALFLSLKKLGFGDYESLDLEVIFNRISSFEINPTLAPPDRVGMGGTAPIVKGNRIVAYAMELQSPNASVRFNSYVTTAIAEIIHHARKKGTYSDLQLDKAAGALMTEDEYDARKKLKKDAQKTDGFIGHSYINMFCKYTEDELNNGITLAGN